MQILIFHVSISLISSFLSREAEGHGPMKLQQPLTAVRKVLLPARRYVLRDKSARLHCTSHSHAGMRGFLFDLKER